MKNCVVILNKLNIYGGISPRLQPTHSPLRNTAIWPLFVGELPHKYKSISNTPVYCENLLKIRYYPESWITVGYWAGQVTGQALPSLCATIYYLQHDGTVIPLDIYCLLDDLEMKNISINKNGKILLFWNENVQWLKGRIVDLLPRSNCERSH